jgi:hypothetical protein|tara:strand:- start:228 stop:479 length:252 start_codon:yes stop_codon:yes gene_type:complete
MFHNTFEKNERLCSEESVFMNSGRCSKAMKIACHTYTQRNGVRILVVENAKTLVFIRDVRNGTENVVSVDSMNLLLPIHFSTE